MDRDSRKVTEVAWLTCPDWTEIRRFIKNKNNKAKFFEYMFSDSGIFVGLDIGKSLIEKIRNFKNY